MSTETPPTIASPLNMLGHILTGTPVWVWALLAGLLVLGYSQTRSRQTGLPRTLAMPLAMGALSLYGTVSALGASAPVLTGWLLSAVLAAAFTARLPAATGTHYDAKQRLVTQAGSWVPMLLILGIFLTKYSVGVSLVLHPALRLDPAFALPVATLYGLFTGLFTGRTLRLLRLVLAAHRHPALSHATQA